MFIANLFHPSPEIRYKQVLLYIINLYDFNFHFIKIWIDWLVYGA
jgi:hypothetical protein